MIIIINKQINKNSMYKMNWITETFHKFEYNQILPPHNKKENQCLATLEIKLVNSIIDFNKL